MLALTSCLEPILHAIMDPRKKDEFRNFWYDLDGDNILEKIAKVTTSQPSEAFSFTITNCVGSGNLITTPITLFWISTSAT